MSTPKPPPAPLELTERERSILRMLAEGKGSNDIADALGYEEGTMRVYLHHLYKKIGVGNKTQAVVWWMAQLAAPGENPDTALLNWIADEAAEVAKGTLSDECPAAMMRARLAGERFAELLKQRAHPRDALRRALNEIRTPTAKKGA